MGGRTVLFQFAVVLLLVALVLLAVLIVLQNNDTQRKLEELRLELRTRSAVSADRPPPVAAAAFPTALPRSPATPGPDGVLESNLSGLRVRAQPYRNPAAVDGGRLVRSYVYDPPGLNPFVFNEALCSDLFLLCNDTLAARDFDDPERWVPQLAERWSVAQTVRIHLPADLSAPELVAAWSQPDTAAERRAVDITALTAVDAHTVELTTDSVRSAYRDFLTARLHDRQQPVTYVYVELEPKYQAQAGEPPAWTLAQCLAAAKAWQGDWTVLRARPEINGLRGCVLVLGDGAAFAARLTAALREASPHAVTNDPASLRGRVTALDRQPYEINTRVTFHLRRSVRWQTIADPREATRDQPIPGPECTARDFVFTWEKIISNPAVPCEFLRNYMADLDAVDAPDKYTVEFTWFRPYFQLFSSSAGFQILPEHIFSQEDIGRLTLSKFNRVICGTGPWKFKRWTADVGMEFERNPDYWGARPHLDALEYKVVKDPTVNFSLFQEGKVDLATLTPDQWKSHFGTPALEKIARTESGVANSYRFVGYNQRLPLFRDRQVRRALGMLVDRDAIIEQIFNGMAVPLTGPFHPQTPNSDPAVKPLPFDPAAAVKMLNAAGWQDRDGDGVLDKDGVPFRYVLLFPSGRPEIDQIAAVIQQGNRKAGIETELIKMDWSAFIDRINRLDFDACILGWRLTYEADPYQLWHSSQAQPNQSNFCGFQNVRADAIIEQGRYLLEPPARQTLYREFHRLIAAEQPYTFLFVPKRMNVYARRFQDVKYTLLETDLNRWYVGVGE